jgi:hypothetical protein
MGLGEKEKQEIPKLAFLSFIANLGLFTLNR